MTDLPFATLNRKPALHWNRRVRSRFTGTDPRDTSPVALMIPLAPKDVNRAAVSIPEMQAMLAHRVTETVIVAPPSDSITALAGQLGARLVDETAPLAALLGTERLGDLSGWLRQQVLKLIAPEITGAADTVTCDADTRPLRPTAYLTPDGRQILYTGDRNAVPFHRFTEALIGPCPRPETSFVAHTMLLRRDTLEALRHTIETRHEMPWPDAILTLLDRPEREVGVLSEFDLIGHFLLRERAHAITTRYYAGIKVPPDQFAGTAPLPRWKRRFRFVSNHERGA